METGQYVCGVGGMIFLQVLLAKIGSLISREPAAEIDAMPLRPLCRIEMEAKTWARVSK